MRVDDLCAFIKAREAHRRFKDSGNWPKDCGSDPIIAQYRFCNVRRNDDRVTKFVFEWLDQWDQNEDYIWFAIVVARLFNLPESLAAIQDHVLPFKPEAMRKVLHKRRDKEQRNFNAAYIVSTNGRAMDKIDYVLRFVLSPLWADRKRITRLLSAADTLDQVHAVLEAQNGLGSFMAAQVVADLKYRSHPNRWRDFHTFAASGPGSKRGLNRVIGAGLKATWAESLFREQLNLLRDKVNAKLRWQEPLTAQDLQNCLCEFDKYERARLGEGKPKQKYVPHMEKR